MEEITVDDLNLLFEEKVAENEQIEYKQALPSECGKDPWYTEQKKIGKQAKQVICEELVAFANAYGGVLLVGICESNIDKSVAESIQPIPKCEELASRFKDLCYDRIEPLLPILEVKGIRTNKDDEGVLMFRVGRSRNAPHREKTDNNCTIRRKDRCASLSMREIQDLTLNSSRGLERINEKFQERSKRFKEEFEQLETPDQALGLRITGIPLDVFNSVEKVYENGEIVMEFKPPIEFSVYSANDDNTKEYFRYLLNELDFSRTVPILQGARIESDPHSPYRGQMFTYGEIYSEGLIELGFLSNGDVFEEFGFEPNYVVGLMAYLLTWSEKMKRNTRTIVSEYAIQVEFYVQDTSILLNSHPNSVQRDLIGTSLKSRVFPKYSYSGRADFDTLLKHFERDLLNSVRLDVRNQTKMFECDLSIFASPVVTTSSSTNLCNRF